MGKILFVCLILILSGCKTLENYELGDVTRAYVSVTSQVISLKAEYCAEINTEARATILSMIRLLDPSYNGVCEP